MVRKKKTLLEKVLVLSPHPDDETLGAGGTLLKYKDLGHETYWLNVTNMKRQYGFRGAQIKKRQSEIAKVQDAYQFDGFFDLSLEPCGLEQYRRKDLVEKISNVFCKIQPNIVILPYAHDVHSSHRIVFESAYSSIKVFRHPYIKKVLMMEVLSETNFALDNQGFFPNYFVDMSDYLEKKIKIARLYKDEIKEHPFPRSEKSIEALAVLRGTQAGCTYAEGFIVLRYIY